MKTRTPSNILAPRNPRVRTKAQAPTGPGRAIDAEAAGDAKVKARALAKKRRQNCAAADVPSIHIQIAERSSSVANPTTTVSFASVTVVGRSPTRAVAEQNIKAGQEAFKQMLQALQKPGVVLRRKRGVPLYRASDDDPSILIRELDGREERVKLVDGKFVAVA